MKHIVYYACCDLPYGKEYQSLFIDGEPNKVFQNPKEMAFSSSPLGDNYCQKIKCNFLKNFTSKQQGNKYGQNILLAPHSFNFSFNSKLF